jgi:hypothetical protein
MSAQSTTWLRPYSYIVTLSMSHAQKSENGSYLVTFDGEETEVNTNKFIFYSVEPLSYKDALKRVEGTKGVIRIEGDFFNTLRLLLK